MPDICTENSVAHARERTPLLYIFTALLLGNPVSSTHSQVAEHSDSMHGWYQTLNISIHNMKDNILYRCRICCYKTIFSYISFTFRHGFAVVPCNSGRNL